MPDDHERQRDQHVAHAAVLERAEQPEGDLERGEGIGREVERERGTGTGEARNGEAGEDEDEQARARTGDEDEQRRPRRSAPAMAATGRAKDSASTTPKRDDRHRAEGRRRRRAEQRRRGERVAQQALQRGPGQAERAADEKREKRARQADLDDDDLRRFVGLARPARDSTVMGGRNTGPTASESRKRAATRTASARRRKTSPLASPVAPCTVAYGCRLRSDARQRVGATSPLRLLPRRSKE